MYSISLIFRPGTYGDDYDRLDAAISAIAAETEGYLGSEGWISEDGKTKSAVYYWSDLKHLRDFAQHMTHREAKGQFRDGSRRPNSRDGATRARRPHVQISDRRDVHG